MNEGIMRRKTGFCLILCSFMLAAAPAMADPKHGKGHGKHKGHKEHGDVVVIDNSDRVVIREYIAGDWRAHCPPGLAKKNNGCLPPGQAKRFVVGQPLPPGIVLQPVPQDLLVRLEPVPVGYQYVMVDKDVLLISEASKKVIDAVTLLSAVGN